MIEDDRFSIYKSSSYWYGCCVFNWPVCRRINQTSAEEWLAEIRDRFKGVGDDAVRAYYNLPLY